MFIPLIGVVSNVFLPKVASVLEWLNISKELYKRIHLQFYVNIHVMIKRWVFLIHFILSKYHKLLWFKFKIEIFDAFKCFIINYIIYWIFVIMHFITNFLIYILLFALAECINSLKFWIWRSICKLEISSHLKNSKSF